MLVEIQASNFRGWNGRQAFTGFDLIIGPNRSGKTNRRYAIQFGVLGYIPGFPAKEGFLFWALSSTVGDEDGIVEIILKFQDCDVKQLRRALIKKNGKVSMVLDVSYASGTEAKQLADDNDGYREQHRRMLDTLYPAIESLDLGVFSQAISGPERERELLKLIGAGDDEWEKDRKFVSDQFIDKMKAYDKDSVQSEVALAIKAWDDEEPWSVGITAVERALMDRKKLINDSGRRTKEANKKLALMGDAGEVGSIPEIESELKTLHKDRDEINTTLGEETSRRRNYQNWHRQIETVKERIETSKVSREDIDLSMFVADARKDLVSQKGKIEVTTQEEKDKYSKMNADHGVQTQGVRYIGIEIDNLNSKLANLKKTKSKIDEGVLPCPYLEDGCPPDTIKPSSIKASIKATTDEIKHKTKNRTAVQKALNEHTQNLMGVETAQRTSEKELVEINELIEEFDRGHQQAKEKELGLTETIERLSAELTTLGKEEPPLAKQDVDTMQKKLDGIKLRIGELDTLKETTVQAMERERQMDELAAQLDELKTQALIVKELISEVKEIRRYFQRKVNDRISYALSGFQSVVGSISFHLGEFYVNKIVFASLSGSEKKIASLSIMLGFIRMREAKFKILFIDDAENIDPVHWKKFAGELRKKYVDLDNFIACGVSLPEIKGATLHKLNA